MTRRNLGCKNEKDVINMFNKYREYSNLILNYISQKCQDFKFDKTHSYKAYSFKDYKKQFKLNPSYSDNFKKYKKESGTKETSINPKTDFIIVDETNSNSIIKCISLKCGDGRITSGDKHETVALFKCVLDTIKEPKNNIMFNVSTFLKEYPAKKILINKNQTATILKKTKSNEEFNKIQHQINKSNINFNKIVKDNPKFLKEVIKEALSGKLKFGNNIATANCFIQLNTNDFYPDKVFDLKNDNIDLEEYVNSLFNSLFVPKKENEIKNVLAWKSSGGKKNRKCWCRFL